MRWVRSGVVVVASVTPPVLLFRWGRHAYRKLIAQAEETTRVAQEELTLLVWAVEHGEPFAWEEDDG